MFRNLEAELKRRGITRVELAKALKINVSSLSSKLNGKRPLLFSEVLDIKNLVFKNEFTIDYLFAS